MQVGAEKVKLQLQSLTFTVQPAHKYTILQRHSLTLPLDTYTYTSYTYTYTYTHSYRS